MDQQPTRHIIQSLRFLSATLLLMVVFNTFASVNFPLPENHQSTYSLLKYGTEVAELKNTFLYQNQQISYSSKAIATGVAAMFYKEEITETSQLYWPANESLKSPQQTSYVLQHTKSSDKNQKIDFAWPSNNQVNISSVYKNRTSTLSSDKAVWTSQLIPILMSSDLLHDEKMTHNNFLIANKGQLNTYYYTFEGHDNIKLDDKTQPCLKFKINKQDRERFSYAWLSKEHFYLPLKVEQYNDGELSLSMTLKHFKLLK